MRGRSTVVPKLVDDTIEQRGVGSIAIEKLLEIDQRFAARRAHSLDGSSDGIEIFIAGDAKRKFDVIVPRLRQKTHGGRVRLEQGLEARVVGR